MPMRPFKRKTGREANMPGLSYVPASSPASLSSSSSPPLASSLSASTSSSAAVLSGLATPDATNGNGPAATQPAQEGGRLAIPKFEFGPVLPWEDTGSLTLLAFGTSLEDGAQVIAKLATNKSAAAIVLEREMHILGRLSESLESSGTTMRVVDYLVIPPAQGDVVVLILRNPGTNILATFFPAFGAQSFLLHADSRKGQLRPENSAAMSREEMSMIPAGEADDDRVSDVGSVVDAPEALLMENELKNEEEMEASFTAIDVPTFLEFAHQAAHALAVLHNQSPTINHGEIRPNAFHLSPSGNVRFAHFGNRSVSLEGLGGPSALVMAAEIMGEKDRRRITQAICYLSPEQTGRTLFVPSNRTDLYALGVVLHHLLTGAVPFDGAAVDVFHQIVTRAPPLVHTIRPDVPKVISAIISKLLEKDPDSRYRSAIGLKADLQRCQAALNEGLGAEDPSAELIPFFPVALHDKFSEFTLPEKLYGRSKEVEIIRNVLKRVTTANNVNLAIVGGSASAGSSTRRSTLFPSSSLAGTSVVTPTTYHPGPATIDSGSDVGSSQHSSRLGGMADLAIAPTAFRLGNVPEDERYGSEASSMLAPSSNGSTASRRYHGNTKERVNWTRSLILFGAGGQGKTAIVLSLDTAFREAGYFAVAKFDATESAPYSAILGALSLLIRQLITDFSSDITPFMHALRSKLGPTLANLSLLFHAVPELEDLCRLFGFLPFPPVEVLPTAESRTRFQSLVLEVIGVLARLRTLTCLFDDLHFGDPASLSLIRSLATAKIRMLLIVTSRPEPAIVDQIHEMFGQGTRSTFVTVQPLSQDAISNLVSAALHQTVEDVLPLVKCLLKHAKGNAFSTRNMLLALQRHHHIYFDFVNNCWAYNLPAIEASFFARVAASGAIDETDQEFVVSHLADLAPSSQRFLLWCSLLGGLFPIHDVVQLMDSDEVFTSGSEESSDDDSPVVQRASETMSALQTSLAEGWLKEKGRDLVGFTHDRYRQAAYDLRLALPTEEVERMTLRIVDMLLARPKLDIFVVAEHLLRCLDLLVARSAADRYRNVLLQAGQLASSQGAHEIALTYLLGADRLVFGGDIWEDDYRQAFDLKLHLAELLIWRNEFAEAQKIAALLEEKATSPVDRALSQRLSAQNCWRQNQHMNCLLLLIEALKTLGVQVSASATEEEAAELFASVKALFMEKGFIAVETAPFSTDSLDILASSIISDALTASYWSTKHLHSVLGLRLVELALQNGMTEAAPLALIFMASTAAEEHDDHSFAIAVGDLAISLCDRISNTTIKARTTMLYAVMNRTFSPASVRATPATLERALQFALAAGERTYSCFCQLHRIAYRLVSTVHLSDSLLAAEEALADISEWGPKLDVIHMARAVSAALKLAAGKMPNVSPETILDDDDYLEARDWPVESRGAVALQYFDCYKTLALFSGGWYEAAAELGFSAWNARSLHASHYHVRLGVHWHSMALVHCLLAGLCSDDNKQRYRAQIDLNQAFLRRWLPTSSINYDAWVHLVDAQLAALEGSSDSYRLFDLALAAARAGDWTSDEAWTLFLMGEHMRRAGVQTIGIELQQKGISRHTHWGAFGLSALLTERAKLWTVEKTGDSYTRDAGVQTDSTSIVRAMPARPPLVAMSSDPAVDHSFNSLSAADLVSIIKSSQIISSEINIFSMLEALTEIVCEASGSNLAVVVLKNDDGKYAIATELMAASSTIVHEEEVLLDDNGSALMRHVVTHSIMSSESVMLANVLVDPRFSSFLRPDDPAKTVACIPIVSKGYTLGAIYLASHRTNAISPQQMTILSLLSGQAAISISTAVLFKKLQKATMQNVRMINSQKTALEEARRSREDALKATRVKSAFVANMSHELRTPFSSFFGLLALLAETELNKEQRDFVSTARASCELLLEIIDSLLDYSKLEAGALKLVLAPFQPEETVADIIELLLPLASKKGIELTYEVDPMVPLVVVGDAARLRQILMNLAGNSLKFTSRGSATVRCFIKDDALSFSVQDTGIGISAEDSKLLFVPFSQVDGSTQRAYGGTGLGLSICMQLVKLAGGSISLVSEVGVGSTFTWTFPCPALDPTAAGYITVESERSRLSRALVTPSPPRILVSTRSGPTRAYISTILKGATVVTCDSADAAVKHLRAARFNLLICEFDREADLDAVHKALLVPLDLEHRPRREHRVRIIQLIAPTAASVKAGQPASSSISVTKLNQPIRANRLLHLVNDLLHGNGVAPTPSPKPAAGPLRTIDLFSKDELVIFSKSRILIAEDNPIASQLLRKNLEKLGFQVSPTGNGQEAVEEWQRHPPSYFVLAIFDSHMPLLTGTGAASKIRSLEAKAKVVDRLPISGLSADCQQSARAFALSAGMNCYLSKPLRQADLLNLIREFVIPRFHLLASP